MKVAVAGATTGVGRCIAESILEHGTHNSPESLIAALSGVHTVISAIGDHSRSADAQLALVHAAVAANVIRFIPSGWSATDGGPNDVVELYRYKQPVLEALRQSPLQWSHPESGIFLNYLATPTKGIGPLKPLKFWIDVENCKAIIPGDGNQKLAYTSVEDVGKFVALALNVTDEWPKVLRIVGATVTHNELVNMAEGVRGKSFDVVHKNSDELAREMVSDAPSVYTNLTAQLSLALLDGRFTFGSNFDISASSAVHFTGPLDFIRKWWDTV